VIMSYKKELVVPNSHNYGIWEQNMEIVLKSKYLWQFTKIVALDFKDRHEKFIVNGKKDNIVEVMMTYIYQEIPFDTSKIEHLNLVWKKLKTMLDKINGS